MTLQTGAIQRGLQAHLDHRGGVRETHRASWYPQVPPIVQMVQSDSAGGVLRAMHAHKLQWDVWHFTAGSAWVQLYDHRTGDHDLLLATRGTTLYIPPGVSHGFYTPDGCTLVYGLTREYDGTDEYEWNAFDPAFPGARLWDVPEPVLSERDRNARSLAEFAAAW